MRLIRASRLLAATTILLSALAYGSPQSDWPDWDRFAKRFIQADGRVIDITFEGKSTSEGQSYGLFFALVANRPEQFATILKWTDDNLADGELGKRLPGWHWGKRDNDSWGIKDRNSASDADLWIAYSLSEAGRLWGEPTYDALGKKILGLIARQEVVKGGAAGTLLLPGPIGFVLNGDRYRINPSYLPGFMFNYFSEVDRAGPWADIWRSYVRLAPKIYARGVAPDIVIVDRNGNVMPDSERTPLGSYDAIRVYLWAGMSGGIDKDRVRMMTPFAKLIRTVGMPPEKVNPETGASLKHDWSPSGFAGAVLPFLKTLDERTTLERQLDRVREDEAKAKAGHATNYYDEALILFGKGWLDGFYRFDERGRLETRWKASKGGPLTARDN